jgi:protein transport protein SEC24
MSYYFITFSLIKIIHFRVMRCSLNVIPQTKDLLNKSRLPLGVLIHPFKDLEVKQFIS